MELERRHRKVGAYRRRRMILFRPAQMRATAHRRWGRPSTSLPKGRCVMLRNVNWARFALYACGYAVGSLSIPAAFQAGLTIGVGLNGYVFGLIFVGVVIASWQLGPMALRCFREKAWQTGTVLSIGWVIAFALVLVASVGFTATNRASTVGSKVAAIERYTSAKAETDRATRELDQLRKDPLWGKTGQCARSSFDYTNYSAYCSRERDLQKRADAARARAQSLEADRPVVGDAQAESIAAATGLDVNWVAKELPIWQTLGIELLAPFLLFAAEAVSGKPGSSRRKRSRKSQRSGAGVKRKEIKKLVQSRRFPNVYYDENYLLEGGGENVADFREQRALRSLTATRKAH